MDTTFTSGTVYISYAAITAWGGDKAVEMDWYTTIPGGFLGLPSSSLSSYRVRYPGFQIGVPTFPFDFGHLPPNQVPLDAWMGQETCLTHQWDCSTIYNDRYAPRLVSKSPNSWSN